MPQQEPRSEPRPEPRPEPRLPQEPRPEPRLSLPKAPTPLTRSTTSCPAVSPAAPALDPALLLPLLPWFRWQRNSCSFDSMTWLLHLSFSHFHLRGDEAAALGKELLPAPLQALFSHSKEMCSLLAPGELFFFSFVCRRRRCMHASVRHMRVDAAGGFD
jgi:hypothetical protein